jgi:hypothetical protein
VCNVHSAHFVLHVASITIVKELDDFFRICQFYIGCGFWFQGCQFFTLFCLVFRFMDYLVPMCLS